jgi:hypothetical protein
LIDFGVKSSHERDQALFAALRQLADGEAAAAVERLVQDGPDSGLR